MENTKTNTNSTANTERERIFVTRSSMPPIEEYIDEIRSIWDSHWLTNMGEKHKALQKALEGYLGVPHVELLVNGHMALELSLQALRLPEGSEVITTPFTFASTTHAIIRNGLKPVFCDIEPVYYTMDPEKIEALITEKTSAILPVHVYGNVCDTDAIGRIAEKHGLKVIYDAAHTFGERYKGRGIGCYGDVSCFSFHATKVFNTIEGGAVSYRDEELGRRLYNLKNFGIRSEEVVEAVGANAKMNEFCAAMGLCNLRHMDAALEKRRQAVLHYRERLSAVPGIRLCPPAEDVESNYAYFPILIDAAVFGETRDQIYDRLIGQEIYTRKYFYPLTNSFDCFRGRFDPACTPVALDISRRILTLPLYEELESVQIDRICDALLSR